MQCRTPLLLIGTTLCFTAAQAAPTEAVLFSFNNTDGTCPSAALVADKSGNLYGTTYAGGRFPTGLCCAGVVFELSPPAAGQTQWTESTLFTFDYNDGAGPKAKLLLDRSGNLIGTTSYGGQITSYYCTRGVQGCGEVFKLFRPKAGQTVWTERVLHRFNWFDGSDVEAGVIRDSAGNLYGTTHVGGGGGSGSVFELSPPKPGQTKWTHKILSHDGGYNADLLADASGSLYVVSDAGTGDNGFVFKLSPPGAGGKTWTQTTLLTFNGANGSVPYGGLIADKSGKLYGTTVAGGAYGYGVAYSLSPPTSGRPNWKQNLLYSFNTNGDISPIGNLLRDAAGNLFGATGSSSSGGVYELSPPQAGGTAWSQKVLYSFTNTANGDIPYAGLMADKSGNLYGTTCAGGASNNGTVFEISP